MVDPSERMFGVRARQADGTFEESEIGCGEMTLPVVLEVAFRVISQVISASDRDPGCPARPNGLLAVLFTTSMPKDQ